MGKRTFASGERNKHKLASGKCAQALRLPSLDRDRHGLGFMLAIPDRKAAGRDPHISVAATRVQVPRITQLRNISVQKLENLISQAVEKPLFGIFGPPKVHVLKLNLALDRLQIQE